MKCMLFFCSDSPGKIWVKRSIQYSVTCSFYDSPSYDEGIGGKKIKLNLLLKLLLLCQSKAFLRVMKLKKVVKDNTAFKRCPQTIYVLYDMIDAYILPAGRWPV